MPTMSYTDPSTCAKAAIQSQPFVSISLSTVHCATTEQYGVVHR